jgi:hypothetical protein
MFQLSLDLQGHCATRALPLQHGAATLRSMNSQFPYRAGSKRPGLFAPPHGPGHNLRGPPQKVDREDTAASPDSKRDSRGFSVTGPEGCSRLVRRPVWFKALLCNGHLARGLRGDPLVDFGLENLVGSVFPARRDLTEIHTHRLVHERNYPVNSLLAKSAVLPEAHDHQPLVGLHDPNPDQAIDHGSE